LRIRYSLSRW